MTQSWLYVARALLILSVNFLSLHPSTTLCFLLSKFILSASHESLYDYRFSKWLITSCWHKILCSVEEFKRLKWLSLSSVLFKFAVGQPVLKRFLICHNVSFKAKHFCISLKHDMEEIRGNLIWYVKGLSSTPVYLGWSIRTDSIYHNDCDHFFHGKKYVRCFLSYLDTQLIHSEAKLKFNKILQLCESYKSTFFEIINYYISQGKSLAIIYTPIWEIRFCHIFITRNKHMEVDFWIL